MQKMTSAYANKMLKSLEEDKVYWVNKEETCKMFSVQDSRRFLTVVLEER